MGKIIAFPGSDPGRLPSAGGSSPEQLDYSPFEHSRWWRLGRDILRCAASSGLRLTESGALPDILARRLVQAHIQPDQEGPQRGIAGPAQANEVERCLEMLELLKLVKSRKGWLSCTRLGKRHAENPDQLYPPLFDLVMTGQNWQADSPVSHNLLTRFQEMAPQSLAFLEQFCQDWFSAGSLVDLAQDQLFLDETDAGEAWYTISVRNYFEPLGLVNLRCLRGDLRRWSLRDDEIKITALFDHFLGKS